MNDYVLRARDLGLAELGFAEHSPWMMGMDSHPLAPSHEEWRRLYEEVSALAAKLKDTPDMPRIRIGVELDYTPNQESAARAFLEKYQFDYVIGSVHALSNGLYPGAAHPQDSPENQRQCYADYFAQVDEMVHSGMVDIIGHVDLPKRDGGIPSTGYLDLMEETLKHIVEREIVVEINTSGKDRPAGEFYPSPAIIRRMVELGVLITLGSDAHSPYDVGRYFDEAIETLKSAGAKEIIGFEKRRKFRIPL